MLACLQHIKQCLKETNGLNMSIFRMCRSISEPLLVNQSHSVFPQSRNGLFHHSPEGGSPCSKRCSAPWTLARRAPQPSPVLPDTCTRSQALGVAYPALYQVRGQVQVGLCSHLVMARCRMEDEVRQRGGVKLGSKGDVG